MGECQSCGAEVKQEGHHLCYSCWKKENGEDSTEKQSSYSGGEVLTATKLGQNFEISGQKMNLLLNELGWIYKPRHGKGWVPTKQGKRQGGMPRTASSGAPYAIWPERIQSNKVLRRAVADFKGEPAPKERKGGKHIASDDFRKKYPRDYRCMDGHYVRSRGEVMIDNWLYTNGITHAYEKRLPIEQDVYSDFYINAGNVYIEYWGMDDENYSARKKVKQKAYKDNEFNLIQLNNDDLNNLDDILPRRLLKFSISVN